MKVEINITYGEIIAWANSKGWKAVNTRLPDESRKRLCDNWKLTNKIDGYVKYVYSSQELIDFTQQDKQDAWMNKGRYADSGYEDENEDGERALHN